jgi:phosphoribosylanthranilate isomerase
MKVWVQKDEGITPEDTMPTKKLEQALILLMETIGELKEWEMAQEKSVARLFLIHGGLTEESASKAVESVDVDVGQEVEESE